MAKKNYLERILSFVSFDDIKPLKILINSGNGTAGPTVDLIINEVKKSTDKLEFYRVLHEPIVVFLMVFQTQCLKKTMP